MGASEGQIGKGTLADVLWCVGVGHVWSFVHKRWRNQGEGPKASRFAYKQVIRAEPCVYCGNPKIDGLDHIHALSRGGPDGWTNRAPACKKCDSCKGDTPMLLFLVRDPGRWKRLERYGLQAQVVQR